MKILTAAEMRAADEATFNNLGIPSRAVMEAAGRHLAELLNKEFFRELSKTVLVITGAGNNGGDGFVLARALAGLGARPLVFALRSLKDLKGDAQSAAMAFKKSGGLILEANENKWSEQVAELGKETFGLIVDAVLGTGSSGAPTGLLAQGIELINALAHTHKLPVFSLDIPSGVNADDGAAAGVAVQAHTTGALAALKFGHLFSPGRELAGRVFVVEIGVREELGGHAELITAPLAARLLRHSKIFSPESHKGRRGHVLIIGGSNGKYGAPKLSALAALRAGAGLVTVALPFSGTKEGEGTINEFMFFPLSESGGGFSKNAPRELEPAFEGKSAILIGPGMGTGEGAENVLEQTVAAAEKFSLPLVLDADALNVLSEKPKLLERLSSKAVLTPHPGEMAKLAKLSTQDIQASRRQVLEKFCSRISAITVLKGARTLISDGKRMFVNPASTAVLGTAGSGDSLGGVIAALSGQGLSSEEAAVVGVYAHGLAGEMLEAKNGGAFGVLASDISAKVASVLNRLSALDERTSFSEQVLPDPWAERLLAGHEDH